VEFFRSVSVDWLGKKWYFFFNYEALRYPNVGTYTKTVPSALLRAGVIQLPDSSGVYHPYNINPTSVTVNGVTYSPATCAGGACDPRGIGISPVKAGAWGSWQEAHCWRVMGPAERSQ